MPGRVDRAAAFFVAVLAAAAAAMFLQTLRLKAADSPVYATSVEKVVSPVCRCEHGRARVAFRLRRADRITVTIVDGRRSRVRTLAGARRYGVGPVVLHWDGRDESGAPVADGRYRPRVELEAAGRTLLLPNPIRVDTRPPHVTLVALGRDAVVSGGRVAVRYRLDEPARALLFVDGTQRVRKLRRRTSGVLEWFGRVGGEPVAPGPHLLQVAAVDVAGNVGPLTAPARVRIEPDAPRR